MPTVLPLRPLRPSALAAAAAFVAVAVVGASSAPARADASLLFARPAADALVVGDALITLGLDLRTVSAFDRAGASRWQQRLEGGGPGDHQLVVVGDRLAVALGDRVALLTPERGRVVGTRQVGALGTIGRSGCALLHFVGACALRCPCSFELVSCSTLAPIGAGFTSPRLTAVADPIARAPEDGGGLHEERDPDRPPASACGGREGALIGRAGDLVVAVVPGEAARTAAIAPSARAVAVDVATGTVRWSSAALGRHWPAPGLSGVAPGARTCWVGGLDGRLEVFDCQTGASRWAAHGLAHRGADPQADLVLGPGDEAGLLVRDGEHVRLRRLDSGHVRWSVHAPVERVVTPSPGGRVRLGAAVDVRVVDPESGATRATLIVPRGAGPRFVEPLDDGFLVAAAGALTRHGPDGTPRARRAVAPVHDLHVGESAVAARGLGRVTLLDRESLLPVYVLDDATYRVLGVDGALGRGVVAVLRQPEVVGAPDDPASLSELRLIRFRVAGAP